MRIFAVSSGIAGAAFHGAIHLGYGLSINNTQLILEGMTYLTHSFLQFKYCPTPREELEAKTDDKVDSLLDLLGIIKEDDKLRQCVMDNFGSEQLKDKMEKFPGSFQRGMVTLSVYGQEMISNYTQRLLQNIPKCKEEKDLIKVRKWLLRNMIITYTFGGGIDNNDFFILHAVTSCWSLCEILKYLDIEGINKAIIEFINSAIACYVVQGAPDIDIKYDTEFEDDEDIKNEIGEIVYGLLYDIENNGKFMDEHVYKLIQVVLECFEENIIDLSCAYYAINKSLKPLDFSSITTPYIAKQLLAISHFVSACL